MNVVTIHDIDERDWHPIDLRGDSEEEICRFVMGFGAFVKVVNPPSLQQKVIERAEAILTNYRA